MTKITTAVLPAAGLGARVMPLTLHQPKPMIGIVDRPMIHYVIDEVVSAGIKHIVIVTGPNQKEFKRYIDYLNEDPAWRKMGLKFDFVIQKKMRGNGDAIFVAKKYLKNKNFLVCFTDDLLADKRPPLKKLVNLFYQARSPIVVLEPVPRQSVSRYGVVVAKKSPLAQDLYTIEDVVEKPKTEEAPSNLTIIGRYVLTPAIMNQLQKLYPYRGIEIGLADALKNYALTGGRLYGWHFRGKRFDAGSKIGILKAQTYFGMHHKELGPEFKKYLRGIR